MNEHGSSGHCAMNVMNQPTFESALALHCHAVGIPIYRNWSFQGSTDVLPSIEGGGLVVNLARVPSKKESGAFPIFAADLRVRAQWLLGADGANSMVRQSMNVDMINKGFECDWLVVDTVSGM
jgi:2-polyprenyl-6-methoxyphenol hydroxylase-like FAD-dependent oxidoreductase